MNHAAAATGGRRRRGRAPCMLSRPSIPLTTRYLCYSTKVNSFCCRITISVNAYSWGVRRIKFQYILARLPIWHDGCILNYYYYYLFQFRSGWETGRERARRGTRALHDRCGGHLETWRHVTSQPSVRTGNVAMPPCCRCRSSLLCFNNNNQGAMLFVSVWGSE